MKPEKPVNIVAFLVLLVAAYYTLFYNFGANPMWVWDEARLANNALEMIDNGNYIITHYGGVPDTWASKPPLMIWCQVASIKAFGYNEFAIRFPSAMAGLLTCFLMIWFSKDVLGSYRPGYFASFILISTAIFVGPHITRTGDYDALLVFFTTSTVLAGYSYLIKRENKYLYLTAISITLAILTKGVAGLFFVPVVTVWIIAKVGLKNLFTNKHFYYSLGIVILFGFGYYVLREFMNPGYFKAVYMNELGGRMLEAQEGNSGEFAFYFNAIVFSIFKRWMIYIILSVLLFTFLRKKLPEASQPFVWYLLTCILFMLLIISLAATKLYWYAAPLYPLLNLVIAAFLHYIILFISRGNYWVSLAVALLAFKFLLYKSTLGMIGISDKVDKYWNTTNRYEPYMQRLTEMKPELTTYNVVPDGYNAQVKFYAYVYNNEPNGITVNQLAFSEVNAKDTVIACEPKVISALQDKYSFEMLDEYEGCTLMVLNSKKDTTKADSSSLISNNR